MLAFVTVIRDLGVRLLKVCGGIMIGQFPKIEGPYGPQNAIVLIIGTPKKVPLMWGHPHRTTILVPAMFS